MIRDYLEINQQMDHFHFEYCPKCGQYHPVLVKAGKTKAGKQMSLGLSARGEFVAPFFSINIGLGANILHNGGDQKAFYQTLALKMRVTHDAYLHVGYNLKNFHDPNFLMLGVGYTFGNRRPLLR